MKKTAAALLKLGIAGEDPALPASGKRFPDGAQYRIEIPSVETPEALSAVLEEADKRKVPIHRASQGSGIMMLTDAELTSMLKIARDAKIELSLFVGPRAGYDVTPQPFTPAGKIIGGSLRGGSQLLYAVEDVKRGCALGLRSVLVADLGLLWILGELKKSGELPANLVLKISILLPVPNPATAHVLESLGAGTINVSPDLSLGHLSGLRGAISAPQIGPDFVVFSKTSLTAPAELFRMARPGPSTAPGTGGMAVARRRRQPRGGRRVSLRRSGHRGQLAPDPD